METTSFTYKTGPCSDVLIIGGGLAGMYSALAAAESGAAVRILCKSTTVPSPPCWTAPCSVPPS